MVTFSKRPPMPQNFKWYSICSRHREYEEECGMCNSGRWVNDELQELNHWLHERHYKVWYEWANRDERRRAAAQPTEVSGLPTPIQDPNDDLAWLVNGIRAQANDYLTKPTGAERLVALTTLRAHALVLREDFQDNGWPVVATETAPAEVSERPWTANEMLDRIVGSLKGYPNCGGDVSVMTEVERIVRESTFLLQESNVDLIARNAQLEAELAALRERLDKATAFKYDEHTFIEARNGFKGRKWCVKRLSGTLNTSGEWEYEPIPSSRDDDYLRRNRYETFEEAEAALSASGGGTKETTRKQPETHIAPCPSEQCNVFCRCPCHW